jgi:hypothetical protein
MVRISVETMEGNCPKGREFWVAVHEEKGMLKINKRTGWTKWDFNEGRSRPTALPIARTDHFQDTSLSYEIDISSIVCVSLGFLDFSDDEALS